MEISKNKLPNILQKTSQHINDTQSDLPDDGDNDVKVCSVDNSNATPELLLLRTLVGEGSDEAGLSRCFR